jgi:putative flippase GtrA
MTAGSDSWKSRGMRWLKFNLVGAIGIVVQLVVLALLKSGAHLHYMVATALAVEAAVIHNFLWHERFTWSDRVQLRWRESLARFLKFNLTTGAFSIAGNLLLMHVLVGVARLPYLPANIASIAACSVVNFLVSDWFVFRKEALAKAGPSTEERNGRAVAFLRSG